MTIQKAAAHKFAADHQLETVVLDPYQIYPFYTIPHALLFQLTEKASSPPLCLVIYSLDAMQRFINIFPDKWEELCSYFEEIVPIIELPLAVYPSDQKEA